MKKRAYIPSSLDRLEGRVVLSGVHFFHGAAVLTSHAYTQTAGDISNSFARFAQHGQNYNRLNSDLTRAVSRIPYNRRDGLLDTIRSEVAGLQDDLAAGAPKPIVSAVQRAMADLHDFVQQEVADGTVVMR